MTAITFDTLMYAKKLQEVGFTAQQAEVQAEAMKEIIDNNLATKQDIIDLKREIKEIENNLRRDIKESMDKIIIRLGSLLVIAVGVLAAIVKL